jgi:hypothetical protein
MGVWPSLRWIARLVETYESFYDGAIRMYNCASTFTEIARIQEEQLQNDRRRVNSYRPILEIDSKP